MHEMNTTPIRFLRLCSLSRFFHAEKQNNTGARKRFGL